MKPINAVLLLWCIAAALYAQPSVPAPTPVDYVNPFIGTDEVGHTFPGASVPFGLVQLSPDTDTLLYTYGKGYNPDMYRYCAGYQYKDNTIVGFSHTHFNGTGHSDLGDVLLMPATGPLKLNPGVKEIPGSGYRSRFSHQREEAQPGYYAVTLDDYNIRAELTATERVGFHRYTFPASADAHIVLDLTAGIYHYEGKNVWSFLRVENDTLVTGWRQTNGWARTRFVYFAIVFSKPFTSYGTRNADPVKYRGFWRKWNENENFPERAGSSLKAYFNFAAPRGETVCVKVAISAVSTANALENLKAELPHWDFDRARDSARDAWNRELSRVAVRADRNTMTSFYTALYHAYQSPVVYSDANGEYRGLDQNIHRADGWTNYTIFSLWDTYRALHPFFTLLQQKRTGAMVRSLTAHYDESVQRMLPVWSHYSNDNWCMIGYHAVSVIADAALKGISGFDAGRGLDASTATATHDSYDGIGAYRLNGYVPEDVSGSSASKTLEYAYDDWTIARLAEHLGKPETAALYYKRAKSYKNLFDPGTGFIRAKLTDGSWKTPFDPLSTVGQGYIEGNAWNYSLYVPHDPKGLITLMGGPERFTKYLDNLFTMTMPEKYFSESEDVTRAGMLGGYVHGNEPSHHVPYLYCYAGKPWKTQERIHTIMNEMYKPAPDGLCGNDDCGQMSAWYIFSALGFYPVAPGSGQYVIGSPCVESADLSLDNHRVFSVRTRNYSAKNVYLQEVLLNGAPLTRCWLAHDEIRNGGTLEFVMSPEPNKQWGSAPDAAPYSMSQ